MSENEPNLRPHGEKKPPLGRYWRQILGSIPDAVTVYDNTGNIVYANELASQTMGYSSIEHMMQQNLSDIVARYVMQDEHGQLMNIEDLPTRKAFREQEQSQATFHCSSIDGKESFWLVAKAFPISTKHKTLTYVVSTYREITTYKEAEAQLKESNRRMLAILDDLMNLDLDK